MSTLSKQSAGVECGLSRVAGQPVYEYVMAGRQWLRAGGLTCNSCARNEQRPSACIAQRREQWRECASAYVGVYLLLSTVCIAWRSNYLRVVMHTLCGIRVRVHWRQYLSGQCIARALRLHSVLCGAATSQRFEWIGYTSHSRQRQRFSSWRRTCCSCCTSIQYTVYSM